MRNPVHRKSKLTKRRIFMNMNANFNTPEDIINQLDVQYRLNGFLKLRGGVAYRAAKLAGMYAAKGSKLLKEACGYTFEEAMKNMSSFDVANTLDGMERSEDDEAQLLTKMGLEANDMYTTLRALVQYSNKLNFDMLDMVDPSGKKRYESGNKFHGVYHTDQAQADSWANTIKLHAEAEDPLVTETYEEYVAKVADERFTLTEEQWAAAQDEGENLYDKYADQILDVILAIGDDEREFDDLPVRAQIACIESLRSKVSSMEDSAVRQVKFMRADKATKIAEASKVIGIIRGFDRQFCDMLDSTRYANYAEFMYGYIPNNHSVAPAQIKAHRVLVKIQPVGRVSDKVAQIENGAKLEEVEIEDDLDTVLPVSALPNVGV